jgi:hypothetical protein
MVYFDTKTSILQVGKLRHREVHKVALSKVIRLINIPVSTAPFVLVELENFSGLPLWIQLYPCELLLLVGFKLLAWNSIWLEEGFLTLKIPTKTPVTHRGLVSPAGLCWSVCLLPINLWDPLII